MDWSAVTQRVVVDAAATHPDDVVLDYRAGPGGLTLALSPRVRQVIAFDDVDRLARPLPTNVTVRTGDLVKPPVDGVSVVVMNDALRRLSPGDQGVLLAHLGNNLPPRALLVIGDVMWSFPVEDIDEPGQFGDEVQWAPATAALESRLRAAGFLPDTHRFGVGRGVVIALRG